MDNQREENQKQFGQAEYQMVHELVYKFQAGDEAAALELIKNFSKFFTKYISLVKFGKYDLSHFSTRSFIKLFVENPKERRLVNPFFKNKLTGRQIVGDTVSMIVKLFESSSQEDILQDLKIIFLTMCQKYKDTKPSFHAYVNKNFHFYAYRYFEKMTRDPINRNSFSSNMHIRISNSYMPGESDKTEFGDKLQDTNTVVESDHTLKNLDLHYNLKHSNIPVIENKEANLYEDNFLDTNWINGVTCGDAFECLTPFERQIITLWYVGKKTDTEIGEIFGVCRGTINRRRGIAKDKLFNYIKNNK
jgi:RNA polymerase sigma factor (sigma-70 family)